MWNEHSLVGIGAPSGHYQMTAHQVDQSRVPLAYSMVLTPIIGHLETILVVPLLAMLLLVTTIVVPLLAMPLLVATAVVPLRVRSNHGLAGMH